MSILKYNRFIDTCVEELKSLQDNFKNEYDVDWYDNWFYNQTTGLLTFSTGEEEINFRYVDIGSFSLNSNSWKWSWDNDSILENVKEGMYAVKEFGSKSGFEKLTTGTFPSDEYEAWDFAAVAARLIKSIGVYRPEVNTCNITLW